MKIEYVEKTENYICKFQGVTIAYDNTEYYNGSLYFLYKGTGIACFDEGSKVLKNFEKITEG